MLYPKRKPPQVRVSLCPWFALYWLSFWTGVGDGVSPKNDVSAVRQDTAHEDGFATLGEHHDDAVGMVEQIALSTTVLNEVHTVPTLYQWIVACHIIGGQAVGQ
jgi:hypothetical protein